MTQDTSAHVFDHLVKHLSNRPAPRSFHREFSFKGFGFYADGHAEHPAFTSMEEAVKKVQNLGAQFQTMAADIVESATSQLRAGAQAVLDATDRTKAASTPDSAKASDKQPPEI